MANFKSAFASARASGKKEFTWNGKRYNTKLADSPAKQKLPSKGPIPAAAPRAKAPAKPGKFDGVSSDDLARTPTKSIPKTGRDRLGPTKPKEESFRAKFKRTVGAPTRDAMKFKIK